LQTRLKFFVEAQKVIGGVKVNIRTEEEVETLNPDGTPRGYVEMKEKDPSRGSELLDKIDQAILAAPVI
jgi:hypothetical protein